MRLRSPGSLSRYIIATTPRSGSTLLCDLLRTCGVMGTPHEYFNVRSTVAPLASKHGLVGSDSEIDMAAYLARVMKDRSTENGVFGAKILFSQLNVALGLEGGRALLTDPGTRYVLLVRQNVVAQAISAHIAWELDAWNSKAEARRRSEGRTRADVEYDEAKIRSLLSTIASHNAGWLEFFEINDIRFLTVTYEDLLADPQRVCRSVCDHCGVPTDHDFALDRAQFKKQGNDVNRDFQRRFAAASGLHLAAAAQAPGEEPLTTNGFRLYESEAPAPV